MKQFQIHRTDQARTRLVEVPDEEYVAGMDAGDVLLRVDRFGHPVTGGVYCLDDSRTCVFDPLRPLEPGQTYTVTLRGEGLMTLDGGKLVEDYWWYFTTVLPESYPPAS